MPRPPSKHGLEKKYKPWRKGKSAASGVSTASRASLKNQLRSQRRLLSKLPSMPEPESDVATRRSAIEAKIAELESQISGKAQTKKERKNAEKYHQVRFFDRQKLTRMERTTKRKLEEAKLSNDAEEIERYEDELESIILDKLYVAHFPHDRKYIALFVNGARVQDDAPTAQKRQLMRDRIASDLREGKLKSKSWLNIDEVKRKGYLTRVSTSEAAGKSDKDKGSVEQRRKEKQAGAAETAAHSHSSGSPDPENIKDKIGKDNEKGSGQTRTYEGSDSGESSSSISESSSSEDESSHPMTKPSSRSNPSSNGSSSDSDSSSSTSDSSSSGSDNEVETGATPEVKRAPNVESHQSDSEDDFFVHGDEEETDTFEKAAQYSVGFESAKRDKSIGWASQNQRPGQYKRRRERR